MNNIEVDFIIENYKLTNSGKQKDCHFNSLYIFNILKKKYSIKKLLYKFNPQEDKSK